MSTRDGAQPAPVREGVVPERILSEACKPWEFSTGGPPDWDSPLHQVFVAGMIYAEGLLAKFLNVETYEAGDGSEDFDSDATMSLQNILVVAGLYDPEEGVKATLAAPPVPEPVVQPAVEAPCHWGGGNDVIWCSTCGEEYAYAKGETRPPCPRTAPPAGEDLAALSEAATLDTRAALSALARFSDQACRAGGFMYLHDALKELGEEAREYDPEVGIFSNREYAAACDALAYLVETVGPNGITLAKTIDAALLPAPTQPAAQGEPVAWACERLTIGTVWETRVSLDEPASREWVRNVRPLYAAPQPAATGRPSVEEVVAILRDELELSQQSWEGDPINIERIPEAAAKILALLAPDQGDEQ